MTLDYSKYLIKNFCFNFVLINTLFFFPLSAIGNRLIINFELDGYIELYCLFIISISLPLSIIFFTCEEISKLVKKKLRLKKHMVADFETVPLIKYLKFYNHNIDTEDQTFIKKILNTSNLNLTNNNGDTILHYISRMQPKSLYIPLLLSCGSDPYIKNKNGDTSMQYIDSIFGILCAKKENEEILITMKSNISKNIIKKTRL